MTSLPQPWTRWMWVAAALLMLAEFLLFDRMTSRHHANIYPRWNDQIQYLSESYQGYEDAKAHGLAHGLRTTLTNPVPQGTLHDVLALLVFSLVGSASRSAALSLNMLAFLSWQASLLFVFSRVGGRWTLGWMAFGLLPCLFWPWSAEAGSAVDFRLDHGAMCLFGISAAVTLLTRGFRSTPWSAGLGVAISFTLIERFLTGVYFLPLFMVSAGWILCGPEKLPRLRNLIVAGLVTVVLAGPVFWLNRVMLYNYYWVGQVSSAEAATRATDQTTWESVKFLYFFLTRYQLGSWFLWTAAGLTLSAFILALSLHRSQPKPAHPIDRDWLFFSFAFFLVPALVLCFHKQKSNVVLGVLVPGVILFTGWIWSTLLPRTTAFVRTHRAWHPYSVALGVAALLAGGKFFVHRQLWEPHNQEFRESARKVNELSDYLFNEKRNGNLPALRVGVDQVTDAFDAQTMRVICYERKKIWMPYQTLLPTGIMEEKDALIMDRLSQCDFVLLTDQMQGDGYWPYDRQMRRLYPALKAWCDTRLQYVKSFTLFERQMSLYQRRDIP